MDAHLGISVGLLIFTRIDGKVKAVLQRRGQWDFDNDKPESYPGAYQITVHGRIESILEALFRETQEELGEDFAAILRKHRDGIFTLGTAKIKREQVVNHVMFLSADALGIIRLHPSSGGLRYMGREELDSIVPLTIADKKTGVTDETIKMFPDEMKVLKRGFAMFGE